MNRGTRAGLVGIVGIAVIMATLLASRYLRNQRYKTRLIAEQTELETKVEGYPASPIKVAQNFWVALNKREETALTYVDDSSEQRAKKDLERYREYSKWNHQFLFAHLAKKGKNKLFNRLLDRYGIKGSERLVILWYAFDSDQNHMKVNTRACKLIDKDGRWKLESWNTAYSTITVPKDIKPYEIVDYIQKDVRVEK